MSLDVYLRIPGAQVAQVSSGIFVRENGQTKEITEQEWQEKNPDRQPVKFKPDNIFTDEVYHANITHNLGEMALQAGIYEPLWRPEEIGITKAASLIGKLGLGLELLIADPERFKTFNPDNGWGDYDGLVKFVGDYLKACIDYPAAEIKISR